MGNKTYRPHGMGFFIFAAIVLVGSLTAWALALPGAPAANQGNVDVLVINGLRQFGALERPAVLFYHDRHTRALAEQEKDCLACHPMNDDRMSLKFQRLDDPDKQSVMELYHNNCIACHQQIQKTQAKSGPVTCGECHVNDATAASDRRPIQLDRSLHYRHTLAMADKCDQCHHQYNDKAKTLFYTKGEEGACLYCHKSQTQENRISYRLAAHTQCIACHREKVANHIEAGPIECAGCHNLEKQNQIEKVIDAPRLKRNQPDAVLVKAHPPGKPDASSQDGMGPVAFDHRAHENYNDSCRVCHHADLGSCARCHTREGTEEGNGIKLSQAMHHNDHNDRNGARMSCVGCHRSAQNNDQCIGCHHAIITQTNLAAQQSCSICHTQPAGDEINPQNDQALNALAEKQLAGRPAVASMVGIDQIPETVTIKQLVDQYEAVIMPHRKIVLALAQGTAENALAQRFHTAATTLCQGCHHNAPGSLTPPQCAGCHGSTSETLNPSRPGLMAAYHQQCIQCHGYMGIDKPASRQCTACHAQRTSNRVDR